MKIINKVIIGIGIISIVAITFLCGYEQSEMNFAKLNPTFTVYTNQFNQGDVIVGSSSNSDAIIYWGYNPKTNAVIFYDEATTKPIKVTWHKYQNIVVFDPITNELQDRGFSINDAHFTKIATNDYTLSGNLWTDYYNADYDNVTPNVSAIYKKGYQDGLYAQTPIEVDLKGMTFDGNGLPLPDNYGISIIGNSDGTATFSLTKNASSSIISNNAGNWILKGWIFTDK